jgi:hypothetical protein
MIKRIEIVITFFHFIVMLITLGLVVYIWIDIGHLPYNDHPDATSMPYYYLIEIMSTIGVISFFLTIPMFSYFGIVLLLNNIVKRNMKFLIIILIYYFISIVYLYWFMYQIFSWLLINIILAIIRY